MKNNKKIFALVLALMLVLSVLVSCGASTSGGSDNGGSGDSGSSSSVKGEMGEHGYYKVLVPEGYELKDENAFGENKPESFNINLKDSSFTYFMFNLYDADNAQASIDATKNANAAGEVTLEAGGKTWVGVAYNAAGIDCFSIMADYGGDFVLVTGAGNAYDSDITVAILNSLEVNVTK